MQARESPVDISNGSPRAFSQKCMRGNWQFAHRVLITTLVVFSVSLVLVFIWYAADFLILLFLAFLISIPLRHTADWLGQAVGLPHGISLAIVIFILAGFVGFVGWLIAARIADQAHQLDDAVRDALQMLRDRLQGYEWFRQANVELPGLEDVLRGRTGLLSRLTGIASTAVNVVIDTLLVVIVGIYFASQPDLYANGIKRLLPFSYRKRADEVGATIEQTLQRWLVGRLALMVLNGGLTAITLSILGVPFAVSLGIVAGLLNFIPNFGRFIAAVPAVLIAFVRSPQLAAYTAAIYIIIQMVDGYVLTPLVDRKSVELPPAITISAQVVLGVFFGFVGLLVASPIAASVVILVKMLYIEDLLGYPIMSESAAPNPEARRSA